MSSLDSTSSQIGSYLLRGWTLLDQTCQICFTPMVRSPAPDRQLLCVKCGRDTTVPLPNDTQASPTATAEDNRPPAGYHPFLNGDDMDPEDDEEHEAGVMDVDPAARAAGTQLDLIRREQSDRASKLIGEKLLQGYCLLDEICSTATCYGIPLLRLPRETERRMCVICQKIYPELPQREPSSVILPPPQPVTLPSIQSMQQSLPPISPSLNVIDLASSKGLMEQAYQGLARELLRLTEALARYDTGSKDYDDYLDRIRRVVETMHTMRK